MSIQSEIDRLTAAKTDIAAAIAAKSVTVPDGTGLDGMAALIGQISGGSSIQMASGFRAYTGGNAIVSGLAFAPVMVVACFDVSGTSFGTTYTNTMWGAAANTSLFAYNATQYDRFTQWSSGIYAQKGTSVDATFTADGFTWKMTADIVTSYTLGPFRWWAFGGFTIEDMAGEM